MNISDAQTPKDTTEADSLAGVSCAAPSGSPSREDKMSAMIDWLIPYYEGWCGPRAKWNKKQRDEFDAKAGFLMLFIDGFKFTKENADLCRAAKQS